MGQLSETEMGFYSVWYVNIKHVNFIWIPGHMYLPPA